MTKRQILEESQALKLEQEYALLQSKGKLDAGEERRVEEIQSEMKELSNKKDAEPLAREYETLLKQSELSLDDLDRLDQIWIQAESNDFLLERLEDIDLELDQSQVSGNYRLDNDQDRRAYLSEYLLSNAIATEEIPIFLLCPNGVASSRTNLASFLRQVKSGAKCLRCNTPYNTHKAYRGLQLDIVSHLQLSHHHSDGFD